MAFPTHTFSQKEAAQLWQEYGDRLQLEDRAPDLLERFPGITARKARGLVTIRNYLLALDLPLDEAARVTFGSSPRPADVTVEDPWEDSDGVREVSHTSHDVNAPIMNLDDLLRMSKADTLTHEVLNHRINTWSTVTKGDDGVPTVTRLWQVSASLRPRAIPLVPLDWNPPPPFKRVAATPTGFRQAVVLPDMQIGFRWMGLSEGNPWADPFHDRKAIDVALQVLKMVQPETVILLGDNLDFQPLSLRWPYPPEAGQTTSIALTEWRWLLRRIRETCPSAHIIYMYGNHEARLGKYLDERVGELKQVTHPNGAMALGLSTILGLDQLDIETRDYPLPYWLWGKIEIEHGRTVRRGGGATAARVLSEREHSVVYGHIHRQEVAHRTVDTPKGKREIVVGSPGCLCRVDGVVPGSDRPDWQQGVGILSLIDGMDEQLDLIRIQNGKAVYGSMVLQGEDYVQEMVADTGAHALIPLPLR